MRARSQVVFGHRPLIGAVSWRAMACKYLTEARDLAPPKRTDFRESMEWWWVSYSGARSELDGCRWTRRLI